MNRLKGKGGIPDDRGGKYSRKRLCKFCHPIRGPKRRRAGGVVLRQDHNDAVLLSAHYCAASRGKTTHEKAMHPMRDRKSTPLTAAHSAAAPPRCATAGRSAIAAKVAAQDRIHMRKTVSVPRRRRKKGIASFRKMESVPMIPRARPIWLGCPKRRMSGQREGEREDVRRGQGRRRRGACRLAGRIRWSSYRRGRRVPRWRRRPCGRRVGREVSRR